MTRYKAETFGNNGEDDKLHAATFSDQTEDKRSVVIE